MKVREAIDIAQPYSKCPRNRLCVMAGAIATLDEKGIDGDIVECGVWRGGGVILARLLSPRRTIWLYDTFNGMANRSKHDVSYKGFIMREGKSAVSVGQVIANLNATKTLNSAFLRVVVGLVENTLTFAENVPQKIALLHLDTDWYHSTKKELEVLWPRLRPSGVMIVDDYGHWKGARKAVDEYFSLQRLSKIEIDKTAIMMVKS